MARRRTEYPARSVGDRVRTRWNGWVTIVEVLDVPEAFCAPTTQYRVDVGKGWITTIWPQDILEVATDS